LGNRFSWPNAYIRSPHYCVITIDSLEKIHQDACIILPKGFMPKARVRLPASLSDVVLDRQNANRGTPRGRHLLKESLRENGAGRSIVLDRLARVIAGNKTVEQARALNLPLRVIVTNGKELVAVLRRDLDLERDPAARALAINDNRVAELDLAWDSKVLEELRSQGLDLGTLWTDDEWAELMGESPQSDPSEDQVLEPRSTQIQRGDLFQLDRHRLLCGDATDAADVARLLGGKVPTLMCTDPPYGVNYEPEWRHRAYPKQRTAVGNVLNDSQASWSEAFERFPGDVVYAWHAGVRSAEAATALRASDFEVRSQIIWVKSHFVLSRGAYHWGHEPCFYAVRRGGRANWHGDRGQSTVWSVPNLNPIGGTRGGENTPTGHSTQKPVRLFEIPILNHTTQGACVYDPFVGSGTTLIAAEKTGRIALVMDLDPRYVQVALDRWEAFTGRKTRRIERVRRRKR